ncbi:hypothetical protein AVEN_189535-1 [Araneus ventricosus]|uniref:Uncharacterized protein n=1 Tax=Araneus ventricosus TaxID=182803 RepID=A0A4Y2GMF6_ARAVE|nr:hypothetical protein AVEN_189535-1 [Araneus ventricosus]
MLEAARLTRKALFQRRVAWSNFESLEVRTCGPWSVEFEQSWRSYGAWLGKYLGSAGVSGCILAIWSLCFPLMRELFTAIMREATDALTSPRATSILSVPTTGNNTNRGRNSWKDRLLERSRRSYIVKEQDGGSHAFFIMMRNSATLVTL